MKTRGSRPVRARAAGILAALLVPLGGTAAAQVAFGGPVPGPLEFAALELRSNEGFVGDLVLLAVLSDGSTVPVFAAEGLSWTRSVEARFFAPELIVGLELRDAASGAPLHAAARVERPADPAGLRAIRARLRALPFPIRGPAGGTPPARTRFEGMDAARSARFATARLFLRPKRRAAGIALASWTLLAALASGLGLGGDEFRRGRETDAAPRTAGATWYRALPAALALACAAAAAWAALLAAPEPLAWSLELPGTDGAMTFEARLEDESLRGGGRKLAWRVEEAGALAFLAFHAPGGEGLPLTAEPGGVYRFSSPPLVTLGADGIYRLSAERFLMAWSFDDGARQ